MDLKELLGEELFKQVSEKLGDKHKIAIVSDGQWIPKDKFDSVNEAKKTLEQELKNRDTQLQELSEKAKGNEELSKKIKELTDLNTKSKSEYEQKIKDITLNSAIEKALMKSNAKYTDLLMSKFDKSKLEIAEDGSIKGLEEQVKTLQESYKELFGETKIVGSQPNNSGGNPNVKFFTKEQIEKMSPSEINANWAVISQQMANGTLK